LILEGTTETDALMTIGKEFAEFWDEMSQITRGTLQAESR